MVPINLRAPALLVTHDLWVQDRIQPTRAFVLTIGGRYQRNSTFGDHVVPKAGAAISTESITLNNADVAPMLSASVAIATIENAGWRRI